MDFMEQMRSSLHAKLDDDALKMVVNQIAVGASAGAFNDVSGAVQAISNGSLAGCPVAVSGKYRTVDVMGTALLHTVDFRNMQLTTLGTTDTMVVGHAIAVGAVLVTDSEQRFSRVGGLKVENWTRRRAMQ